MKQDIMKSKIMIVISGLIIGIFAVVLVVYGNPKNMGFCIACFLRDIAGSLGFHQAPVVQYMRPEIIGLVLGAFIAAFAGREFSPRAGSSPMTRFILGICVMVGALVFLGCPLRMILRIGGGDLNAVVGLVGFVAGIFGGTLFLRKGYSLKRAYPLPRLEGALYPAGNLLLFGLFLAVPSIFIFSKMGPGSMHAPVIMSLSFGLIIGFLAQKTRFCTLAGFRDTFLFKDFYMLFGLLAVVFTVMIGNMITGNFHLSFTDQPIAHSDGLWNFLGMALVGLGSALLGGCPLRQLILSGEGNTDSVVTVLGLVAGSAICHNFKIASTPEGPSQYGPTAVIACLAIVIIIALYNTLLANRKKGD